MPRLKLGVPWTSPPKSAPCPPSPACTSTKTPKARSSTSARPTTCASRVALLFPRGPGAGRENRHPGPRGCRRRLHRRRQHQRGAGPRKQPHQAEEAALQHSAARRQDLSVCETDAGRTLPPGLRHPPPAQRRRGLLRSLLPCQSGLPHRGSNPSQLPDSVLQGGFDALSFPALACSTTSSAAWDRACRT